LSIGVRDIVRARTRVRLRVRVRVRGVLLHHDAVLGEGCPDDLDVLPEEVRVKVVHLVRPQATRQQLFFGGHVVHEHEERLASCAKDGAQVHEHVRLAASRLPRKLRPI